MKTLLVSFKNFIKREPVLFAALLLAVGAVCLLRPGVELCLQAIDFRTLAILFSLMIVIKAFQSQNFLDFVAARLLRLCKTRRSLYFLLTYLVFFSSMFVTNDVALLTFVPISLLIFKRINLPALHIVVLETLAANLGSCITPMGNPQNLYLFSYYGFGALEFFALTAKIAVPAFLLLTAIVLFLTRRRLADHGGYEQPQTLAGNVLQSQVVRLKVDFRTVFYVADFVLCLLAVFHTVNYLIMLCATVVVMAFCNWRLFKKVDYSLLLTFVGFFIFTKTLSTVPAFSDFIKSLLSSPLKTYLTGIAASQIISNVPAALLLSGFTDNGAMLLLAVNVGGLGTLIASMASVISFKLYSAEAAVVECPQGGRIETTGRHGHSYFAVFTAYNVVLLAVLGIIVYLL
ncbi:SLC13 family permease [Treponema bryantii]|uniref:SLC13 family permease n=1 Tax=Treponema bryantii TaxID=163 RepID=UPI0003B436B7|nr:SLC13 family permease [Treponema bryantii]